MTGHPFIEESNLEGVHFTVTHQSLHRQRQHRRLKRLAKWLFLVIAFLLCCTVAALPVHGLYPPLILALGLLVAPLLMGVIRRFYPEQSAYAGTVSIGARGLTVDEQLWPWSAHRFALRVNDTSELISYDPDTKQYTLLAMLMLNDKQHRRIAAAIDAGWKRHQQAQQHRGEAVEVPAALHQMRGESQ